MQLVTGISDSPAQVVNLTAEDGSVATFTLAYRPQQKGWFFDMYWAGVSPAVQVNGRRITAFPNLLRQFRNVLPFGLACVTRDNQEPIQVTDFSSRYATLLFLSSSDITSIESQVFPGLSAG